MIIFWKYGWSPQIWGGGRGGGGEMGEKDLAPRYMMTYISIESSLIAFIFSLDRALFPKEKLNLYLHYDLPLLLGHFQL